MHWGHFLWEMLQWLYLRLHVSQMQSRKHWMSLAQLVKSLNNCSFITYTHTVNIFSSNYRNICLKIFVEVFGFNTDKTKGFAFIFTSLWLQSYFLFTSLHLQFWGDEMTKLSHLVTGHSCCHSITVFVCSQPWKINQLKPFSCRPLVQINLHTVSSVIHGPWSPTKAGLRISLPFG